MTTRTADVLMDMQGISQEPTLHEELSAINDPEMETQCSPGMNLIGYPIPAGHL